LDESFFGLKATGKMMAMMMRYKLLSQPFQVTYLYKSRAKRDIYISYILIRFRAFCLLVCCQKNLKIRIYKTIILPVVLYGCGTWSLTLREEQRLRVFENRVLRRIFGPMRDEVKGEWRKLHNEELHDLYFSPSIIRIIKPRRMRWAGHVARMGEKKNAYRLLVGKPEGRNH
jgi:hypothetical protein